MGLQYTAPDTSNHNDKMTTQTMPDQIVCALPTAALPVPLDVVQSAEISANGSGITMDTVSGRSKQTKTAGEITVNMVVGSHLFAKVKFMHKWSHLMDYCLHPQSVCGRVLKHCHIEKSDNKEEWWSNARVWVVRELSQLRNNKSS